MNSVYHSQTTIRCILLLILPFLGYTAFSQIAVSGQITTLDGVPQPDYVVLATGTETKVAYTDANGVFTFFLQEGGSYEIKPSDCRQNPLNGVSTFDRVLIDKHINGTELLATPYRIIAADIDDSGTIDLQDDSLIVRLILGIIPEFPNGNLRYVPKNYLFPDPQDPFNPPYARSVIIPNLQTAISNADFFVMKVGDVNSTAILDGGCLQSALNSRITGKVFRDQTPDCQYVAGEPTLAGWKVAASNGAGSFFGTTNSNGNYEINLLPGTYDVSIIKPNNLWVACVDTLHDITANLTGGTATDFAVQSILDCPAMDVDLSISILRRCFSNSYKVSFCNLGTATAENVRVELDLDPFFTFVSSTVPSTFISGNTYSFDAGDVPSGSCGEFQITFELSCDAVLGQTHCTEARIFPDTICSAAGAWAGPDLHVTGICDGDNVKFTITNTGGDMLEPSSYIVVEDIVVMVPPMLNPFVLPAGGSEIITIPANGTTVRMEVNQPPGHPWSNKASATVEGCGTNGNGSFSLGMVNLFPQNDQSPLVDIDCKANTGSFDPNDKQGFPTGVLNEHFIPLNQPIEYLIRFQNTGTDTAFTVIVRDTLDADLDVRTIRPLGSSHPYTFNLSGQGIAQFVFTNIMLPDSNINEAASHGYVKFVIEPKSGMPEGTVIENDAAIYFDFNAPVITNTTWHTLGSKYLGTSSVVFNPEIGLDVFPNPTTDVLNFLIKSIRPIRGTLQLFDLNGKLVATETFDHNKFIFNTKGLMAGYYIYKVKSEGVLMATGKVIKIE